MTWNEAKDIVSLKDYGITYNELRKLYPTAIALACCDIAVDLYADSKVKNFIKSNVISSLDLRELERKLDEALEKETAESLIKWLNEQRQ